MKGMYSINGEIFDTRLSRVQIDITNRCNLNCIHCRARANEKAKDALSFSDITKTIKLLAKGSITDKVIISGGEPFLRKDLCDIIECIKSTRIKMAGITTNGTVMQDSVLKRLKLLKHNFKLEFSVSLDGCKPETHDYFRGKKGAFEAACEGIKRLVDFGLGARINMTVTNDNINDVIGTYRLACKLSADAFSFRAVIQHGRCAKRMDLKKYRKVLNKLFGKNNTFAKRIPISSADPQCNSLLELTKYNLTEKDLLDGTSWGGCSAGIFALFIDHTGNIAPCPYLSNIKLGNIKRDNIIYIWKNHKTLKILRNRGANLSGRCSKCKFKFLCGGCRSNALVSGNGLMGEDPLCIRYTKISS